MNTQQGVSSYGTRARMADWALVRTLCAISTPAALNMATGRAAALHQAAVRLDRATCRSASSPWPKTWSWSRWRSGCRYGCSGWGSADVFATVAQSTVSAIRNTVMSASANGIGIW